MSEGPIWGNLVNSISVECPHVITGARFTNVFLPTIQIWWKFRLAITPLLAIRSQQIFAHATTAQLSCRVQNFVAITVLESRWEVKRNFHQILIAMEKTLVKRAPGSGKVLFKKMSLKMLSVHGYHFQALICKETGYILFDIHYWCNSIVIRSNHHHARYWLTRCGLVMPYDIIDLD